MVQLGTETITLVPKMIFLFDQQDFKKFSLSNGGGVMFDYWMLGNHIVVQVINDLGGVVVKTFSKGKGKGNLSCLNQSRSAFSSIVCLQVGFQV